LTKLEKEVIRLLVDGEVIENKDLESERREFLSSDLMKELFQREKKTSFLIHIINSDFGSMIRNANAIGYAIGESESESEWECQCEPV